MRYWLNHDHSVGHVYQHRKFCEKSTSTGKTQGQAKVPGSIRRAGKPWYGLRITMVSGAIGGAFAYIYGIPPEIDTFVKENIEMIVCFCFVYRSTNDNYHYN